MEVGRHRGITANEHIMVGSKQFLRKIENFKYLGFLLTN